MPIEQSWNKQKATELAFEEKIQLTSEHWEIVRLFRAFFVAYGIHPSMRIFLKYLKEQSTLLEKEKINSLYLQTLFPDSPMRQMSKIAGLPRPEQCI